MDSIRPELSIIVPAYNEAGNVAALAAQVAEIAGLLGRWELVFVNDGSTDDTLTQIKNLAAQDERVRFVSFVRNFGHQAALRAGLRHARGAAAVLMDCDFEHPPELIPALLAEWRRGAKIVVTERDVSSGSNSYVKRLTSQWFYRLLNAIGDVRIEPGSADFLLVDRVVVDRINGFDDQEIFLRGLVRWFGYPLVKVPYVQGVRRTGESKYSLRRMIDFAVSGIIAHSIKPLRIAIYLSLSFAAIGMLLLVYSLVSFVWIGHTVAGWTSIMATIAILGAGQFLVFGIIGEYVGRTLRETRRWPVYIIAETETSGAGSQSAPSVMTAYPREAAGSAGS